MTDFSPTRLRRLADERHTLTPADLMPLLEAQDDDRRALYAAADAVRREKVGDEVFLRGIIEFSNYCRNDCAYCGIRAGNPAVRRYRMPPEEIISRAEHAGRWGCTSVVLQSGEDPWFTTPRLCEIVTGIKRRAAVAVTLSVGLRSREEIYQLRDAGCARCLVRFETSDPLLFARIHPDQTFERRIQCLHDFRAAGFQLGSGFMIGLPGAPLETLAADLLYATRLDLDMIGCGPFIAHADTPLAGEPLLADREIYFKTIALLRLLNPLVHLPATTAFDALVRGGRDRLLQMGCNIFMPNLTPSQYRAQYQLYPGKPCVDEDGAACTACVTRRV
ncbi:MAG: [FeFe] hydrogenase H-cluster radical SAM maturase HydE, partial [Lentisphaeria bacterium]